MDLAGSDDPLRGDDPVLDPGTERARRLAGDLAAVLLPGRRSPGGRRRRGPAVLLRLPDVVVGLHAAGVAPARAQQLGVDLVDESSAQHHVGDYADHRAGHGEQRHQPGDQAPAQGAPGQPAAQAGVARPVLAAILLAHQLPGLSTYPTPRTVWISGSRPASIFLRR